MEIIFWIIWLFCGILGCLIFNKTFTYESVELKRIWNIIVCACGFVGLLLGCLTWIGTKIK